MTRFYPPIFQYFSSTFIQRKDVTNPDQHPTATQGNATPQGWKTLATITLALEPKDLPASSNSSSFMIHCWCFLLRISETSHVAQDTQARSRCVEKYLLRLTSWNISPTSSSLDKLDLTSTKCPSFKVHYWTSKTTTTKPNRYLGDFSQVQF